jgi:hypothetical protein
MRNWEEGALSPELLKAVQKVGYTKPSPIQMAAIPIGLQQRDVIGIAETGMFNLFDLTWSCIETVWCLLRNSIRHIIWTRDALQY